MNAPYETGDFPKTIASSAWSMTPVTRCSCGAEFEATSPYSDEQAAKRLAEWWAKHRRICLAALGRERAS